MKKPNCVFITADHLRYDVLGKGYTPNIDRLMGESVTFSNAYCASPLCVPARGSLFTGNYPAVNGSIINGWFRPEKSYSRVKEGIDNLYHLMERMDMECIHSGKQHLFVEGVPLEEREDSKTKWLTTESGYRQYVKEHGKRMPGGPGFRSQVPEMSQGIYTRMETYSNATTGCYEEGEEFYFDRYFTDLAVAELEQYEGEEPLFLSMMYLAPHPPFDVPEPWYSHVKEDQMTLPENVGVWYPHQSPLQKYNLTGVIGNLYGMEDWKEPWRVYLGLVALLDDCVGRIVEALKAKSLYDDSIIVFTSDHGEMLGAHRLFQKMCMYEESAHVPLSIHVPGGCNAGKVIKEGVSHIDIFPTICDFYGKTPEHPVDGVSLKPCLTGDEKPDMKPIYIQYDGNGSLGNFQRCIVWKEHKLIVDRFKDETFYELYDLEQDRLETKNLLFEEGKRELAEEMFAMLKEHMEAVKDFLEPGELRVEEFLEIYV